MHVEGMTRVRVGTLPQTDKANEINAICTGAGGRSNVVVDVVEKELGNGDNVCLEQGLKKNPDLKRYLSIPSRAAA